MRREEVAQLASISPTWYTWLEQGARWGAFPRGAGADRPRSAADHPGARASVYSRLWPSAADASDGDG
ncbi:helix-turn-helix domain-containing protein [Klebsiella pneumoniae subsp. pneumoniae]|nr:helix-turn-helix domain-containing protein [Klebsiella pneumoniae subsp. pneumoniae]